MASDSARQRLRRSTPTSRCRLVVCIYPDWSPLFRTPYDRYSKVVSQTVLWKLLVSKWREEAMVVEAYLRDYDAWIAAWRAGKYGTPEMPLAQQRHGDSYRALLPVVEETISPLRERYSILINLDDPAHGEILDYLDSLPQQPKNIRQLFLEMALVLAAEYSETPRLVEGL